VDAKVIRGGQAPVSPQPWGGIQWLVGGSADEATGMTFGRVTLQPGKANVAHRHPNCEEILFVVSGEIEHSLPGGGTTRLAAGDCIVLPRGQGHQARNVGQTEAVVVVAFNSAHRETVAD